MIDHAMSDHDWNALTRKLAQQPGFEGLVQICFRRDCRQGKADYYGKPNCHTCHGTGVVLVPERERLTVLVDALLAQKSAYYMESTSDELARVALEDETSCRTLGRAPKPWQALLLAAHQKLLEGQP